MKHTNRSFAKIKNIYSLFAIGLNSELNFSLNSKEPVLISKICKKFFEGAIFEFIKIFDELDKHLSNFKFLSKLKGISFDDFSKITTSNFFKLFGKLN